INPIFYTSDEVEEAECCSKETLFNKLSENSQAKACHSLPPYINQGGKTLFPISDFHHWIETQPLISSGEVHY
ncbi:DNA-binding protein, partial [Pseudoalteromonas ruthenica]|uniref:DNA-binding protein n=1 Tax=Pseudoalteromonas ruthenica TaxID=151081 RepID=UPI0032119496